MTGHAYRTRLYRTYQSDLNARRGAYVELGYLCALLNSCDDVPLWPQPNLLIVAGTLCVSKRHVRAAPATQAEPLLMSSHATTHFPSRDQARHRCCLIMLSRHQRSESASHMCCRLLCTVPNEHCSMCSTQCAVPNAHRAQLTNHG